MHRPLCFRRPALACAFALFVLAGEFGAREADAAPDAVAAFRRARSLTEILADRVFEAQSAGAEGAAWDTARAARDRAVEAVRGARADLRAAVEAGEVGPEVERLVASYLVTDMQRVADLARGIPAPPPPDAPPPSRDDPLQALRAIKSLVAHQARLDAARAAYVAKYDFKTFNATTRAAGTRVGVADAASAGNWLWLGTKTSADSTNGTAKALEGVLQQVRAKGADPLWIVMVAESLDRHMAAWQIQWSDLMATMEEIVDLFVENHVKRRGPRDGLPPLYSRAQSAVGPAWVPPPQSLPPPAPEPAPEGKELPQLLDRLARVHAAEERGVMRANAVVRHINMDIGDGRPVTEPSAELNRELEAAEDLLRLWYRRYYETHYALRFGSSTVAEVTHLDGIARTAAGLKQQAATAPAPLQAALSDTARVLEENVKSGDARVAKAKVEFNRRYAELMARSPLPEPDPDR